MNASGFDDSYFDIHVHLGASDTGELYYGLLEGEEYLDLMDAANVSHAIAFAPLRTDGYRAANLALADWCETTGGRVRPFARLGGDRLPVSEPQLWIARRAARAAGGRLLGRGRASDLPLEELGRFAGVKLLPHLDGVPDAAVFDAINAARLPVLTHAGRYATPRFIARTILPRVAGTLVLAHLGAFPDRERELRDAVALAEREPRVVLDTSGIWIADFLDYAVRRVPEQICFGSDCPLTTPATARAMLESVVTDRGLRRRIGFELAAELLGTP